MHKGVTKSEVEYRGRKEEEEATSGGDLGVVAAGWLRMSEKGKMATSVQVKMIP